jgi:hypothetical protein
VATANGDTARLAGFAMMAVVAAGALISRGYRHMEELSGLPAFIAKLPGYCFLGHRYGPDTRPQQPRQTHARRG